MYTIARNILGWSDHEFWKASPRKYFAVLCKYTELKKEMSEPKQDVLVGKDAFYELSQLAGRIR